MKADARRAVNGSAIKLWVQPLVVVRMEMWQKERFPNWSLENLMKEGWRFRSVVGEKKRGQCGPYLPISQPFLYPWQLYIPWKLLFKECQRSFPILQSKPWSGLVDYENPDIMGPMLMLSEWKLEIGWRSAPRWNFRRETGFSLANLNALSF